MLGWTYLHLGEFLQAKDAFLRSLSLSSSANKADDQHVQILAALEKHEQIALALQFAFSSLALTTMTGGRETGSTRLPTSLWSHVFKYSVALDLWDEAYAAITAI